MSERKIRSVTDPLSGEKIYEYVHKSGARVSAVNMQTSLSAASVSVPYGGGISDIYLDGFRYVPSFPGAAHFAEHMIFTGSGGRLEKFCSLGADANAETSMTGTTYYMTAGDKYLYALGDLASMVSKPTFNRDELEKEREIILREKSDDDDIFTKGRNALMCLMFERGSIRREIIGDTKSINKMNGELLNGIYVYAYRPAVMAFASVSDRPNEDVFDMIDAALLGANEGEIPTFRTQKSKLRLDGSNIKTIRKHGDSPMLFCGISPSMAALDGNYARMQVYSSMLESMLFDRTEYIGELLNEKGKELGIHGGCRSDAELFFGDLVLSASIVCDDPTATSQFLEKLYSDAIFLGSRKIFPNIEAKRRSLIADYISVYDSPSDLALTLSEYSACGSSFSDVACELVNFSPDDFFDFADSAMKSARIYFVLAK